MKAFETWWFEFTYHPWMGGTVVVCLAALFVVLLFRAIQREAGPTDRQVRLNRWKNRQRKGGET